MRERMEQEKMTTSLWLNVGFLNDDNQDKTVALERARRGVRALGLEWVDMIKRDRRGHVADTRHMVSKYLRDCGFSYKEISQSVGRINHTTSCYSVRKCNELLSIDRHYRKAYNKFLNA